MKKRRILQGCLVGAMALAAAFGFAACSDGNGDPKSYTLRFTLNGEALTQESPAYVVLQAEGESALTEVSVKEGEAAELDVYLSDYLDADTLQFTEGGAAADDLFTPDEAHTVTSVGFDCQKVGVLHIPAVTADRTFALTCEERAIKLNFTTKTDESENLWPDDAAIQTAVFNSLEVYAGGAWRNLSQVASQVASSGEALSTTYTELQSTVEEAGDRPGIRLRSQKYLHGAFYGADGFMTANGETAQVLSDEMNDLDEYLFPMGSFYATEYTITLDQTRLVIEYWNVIANGSVWQKEKEKEWGFRPLIGDAVADFSFSLDALEEGVDLENVKVFVYDEELTAVNGVYTLTKAPCEYAGCENIGEYRLTLQGLDAGRGQALTKITLENTNPSATLSEHASQASYAYYWDETAIYYPAGMEQKTTLVVEYIFTYYGTTEIEDFEQTDPYQSSIQFKAAISYQLPTGERKEEKFDLADFLPGMDYVTKIGTASDEEYEVKSEAGLQMQVQYSIDRRGAVESNGEREYTEYGFVISFTFVPAVDMTATISM